MQVAPPVFLPGDVQQATQQLRVEIRGGVDRGLTLEVLKVLFGIPVDRPAEFTDIVRVLRQVGLRGVAVPSLLVGLPVLRLLDLARQIVEGQRVLIAEPGLRIVGEGIAGLRLRGDRQAVAGDLDLPGDGLLVDVSSSKT